MNPNIETRDVGVQPAILSEQLAPVASGEVPAPSPVELHASLSGISQNIEMRRVEELRPFPLNAEVYGDTCDEALIDSIREHRVREPLVILANGTVLGGHRRFAAAKKANLAEVPVRVCQDLDDTEAKLMLLDLNKARMKTMVIRLREFELYLNLESSKAAGRKGQRNDLKTNSTSGDHGSAREIAAKKVGLSGTSAMQGLKVLTAVEKHRSKPESDQVIALLNEKGINGAFKKAVQLGWLHAPGKVAKGALKAPPAVPASSRAKPDLPGPDRQEVKVAASVSAHGGIAEPSDNTPVAPEFDEPEVLHGEELDTAGHGNVFTPEEPTAVLVPPEPPATLELNSFADNLPTRVVSLCRLEEAIAIRADESKEGPDDAAEIRRFIQELAAFINRHVGPSPTAGTLRNLQEANRWLEAELVHLLENAGM